MSLAACGSQGISFRNNDSAHYAATGSAPIPSEPVYGYPDKGDAPGGHDRPQVGSAAPASYEDTPIKRGALAPLPVSYTGSGPSRALGQQDGAGNSGYPRYASNAPATGEYAGGSFAMQPIEAAGHGAQPPVSSATAAAPKRYAADYRSAPSYDQPPRRYGDDHPNAHQDAPYRTGSYGGAAPGHGEEYVVVEGDTLFSIAKRHGLTTTELAELNGISGSTIYPGQRLHVHGAPKYTGSQPEKAPYDEDAHYQRPYAPYADERKAPPAYTSYSDYRARPPYGANGGPRDPGYDAGSHDRAKPYDDRGRARYDDKPYSGSGDYADKGDHADHADHQERPYDHQASRYEDDKYHAPDRRDPPEGRHAKGTYFTYSVRPGDTLYEIARRHGLSHRELADYNDIPARTPLYSGQVLHIPKGAGYDPNGRRGGPADDRDDRDRYSRGTPYSQNAPADDRNSAKNERRVANAEAPDDGRKVVSDASPAERRNTASPEAKPAAPQSILAANRDVGAGVSETQGGQTDQKDCEALLAAPASRATSTFREPVQGVIIGKFGAKPDGSFSDGVDFSVPKGTPVKAAENGVIAYVGNELPGFGNLILVRHADGYVTAYAHNEEMLVHRCEVVKRGEVIAKVGATGKVDAPQLHFELRKDSKPIDPEGFFSRS